MTHFQLIDSVEALAPFFDEVCEAARKLVIKTGGHGTSAETMVEIMVKTLHNNTAFLLLFLDENDVFQGFAFSALVIAKPPWVDFIGLWTKPGIASETKFEAFKILKDWALARGCKSILAGITRRPELFFRFFHQPLGFNKIGFILEYDLTKEA